jgi:GTPase SAR1 family protein
MNNKLNFNNTPTPKNSKNHKKLELMVSPDRESYKASDNALRKVVIIGNAAVGKTSIISRFVNNSMPSSKKATIGALEKTKSYYLDKSGRDLNVVIWDVSG